MAIPVIDLFAGPGGLGEGFSAFAPHPRAGSVSARSLPGYQIALSIEKDPSAWQTLRLRSFFRQFDRDEVPELYYALLRGDVSLAEFLERLRAGHAEWYAAWERADREAIQAELGAPGEQIGWHAQSLRWAWSSSSLPARSTQSSAARATRARPATGSRTTTGRRCTGSL